MHRYDEAVPYWRAELLRRSVQVFQADSDCMARASPEFRPVLTLNAYHTRELATPFGQEGQFLDKTAGVSGKETGFLAEAVGSVAKTIIPLSRNWVTWA